jgi:starch synthase (maltosyl-transferring)
MNVTLRAASAVAQRLSAHPRIRYVDPLVTGSLEAAVARAGSLGFDAVMIPPPWAPGADGDRFAPASLDLAHPKLGGGEVDDVMRRFARLCRQNGLGAMIDVPLARLAADFAGDDAPFTPVDRADSLDPRRMADAAVRRVADSASLGAWWARRIRRWSEAGLTGFRLLDLADAAGVIPALREAVPEAILIGWTPGLPRTLLPGLRGVSYVVSSLPWWDGEADWFWDELDALAQVAPVLACPEAPFGPRLAAAIHNPAKLGATLRRAASLACATGDGWLVPEGFETGARRPLDPRGLVGAQGDQSIATGLDLAAMNQLVGHADSARGIHILTGGGAPPMALLRTDAADPRFASRATVALVNTDLERPRAIDPAAVIAAIDGSFGPWEPMAFKPGRPVLLQPGELRSVSASAMTKGRASATVDADAARRFANGPRVAIEAPSPCVDDGALPVKRLVGEVVTVEVDVVCDGHDKLGVALQWREPGPSPIHEVRMEPAGNDRYRAELPLTRIGAYEYTVQAWRDAFASYKDEIAKKSAAGVDVTLELREGMALLQRTVARAQGQVRTSLEAVAAELEHADDKAKLARFLSADLAALMAQADDRPRAATLPRPVRIDAERSGAAFSAWYEVFPRSMSDDPNRHGTFRDVERHLPRVKAMGFDVLYFPPIHPIGRINRKGPNNTLTPGPTDPGSPYAIGSAEGGHDALHPELGTLEDFRHLVAAAAEHGLEIAIDFAIQCSPDHPWLKQHRGWFDWRPDGSIKYAENPPKKYQDIVNVDFYAQDAIPGLWVALAEVVMFWMEQGVRCIRVDNPHTKPFPFWQWMIATVRERYPDAVFLAEAFTRPKVMYRLAKVGFSQSYTYFTWRETKREMEQYLTELAAPGPRDFFRPHFFVNTPDINPVYLQGAPRSMYLMRAALAATLSGLWGVYNGFELCEATPLPGREEYLDSEKYQIRAWDWDRPGNIVAEITALNRIRHTNPALRTHLGTTFLSAANDLVSVYMKATQDRSNVLVVAVSFDGRQAQETPFEFPFWLWQVGETAAFEAEDLLTGERQTWRGKAQYVRLSADRPYVIWRIRAVS